MQISILSLLHFQLLHFQNYQIFTGKVSKPIFFSFYEIIHPTYKHCRQSVCNQKKLMQAIESRCWVDHMGKSC